MECGKVGYTVTEPEKSGLPRVISHVEVSTIGSNFPFRRRNNIAELKNEIITAVKLSCQSTVLLHNLRYSYIIQRIVRIMCEVSSAVCVQSSVVCLQRTSVE